MLFIANLKSMAIIDYFLQTMVKSPQQVAQQAQFDYRTKSNYLALRTQNQLHLMKQAATSQKAYVQDQHLKERYSALIKAVDIEVNFRQKNKKLMRVPDATFGTEKQDPKQNGKTGLVQGLLQHFSSAYSYLTGKKTKTTSHQDKKNSQSNQASSCPSSQSLKQYLGANSAIDSKTQFKTNILKKQQ